MDSIRHRLVLLQKCHNRQLLEISEYFLESILDSKAQVQTKAQAILVLIISTYRSRIVQFGLTFYYSQIEAE